MLRVRDVGLLGAKVGIGLSAIAILFAIVGSRDSSGYSTQDLTRICISYVLGGAAIGGVVGVAQPLLTTRLRAMIAGTVLGCAFMFGLSAVMSGALAWSFGDILLNVLIGLLTGSLVARRMWNENLPDHDVRH